MKNSSEKLEYWFTVGMSKGYSFEDAVEYADKQLQTN